MRLPALVLLVACGKHTKDAPHPEPVAGDARAVSADAATIAAITYPDLGSALAATIPADARVVGFGELHVRTDSAQVKSSLAHFTATGLPAIQDKISDIVIETWIPDPKCGQQAKTTTAKVEVKVKRPQETKNDIQQLADAARAAKIQPHAMRLKCEDYEKIAPTAGDVNTDLMLDLITSELGRIAESAIIHRDKEPGHRPWIALYGGMVHNDRSPAKGVEKWSYAARVDKASADHFVEIDLIVPELAESQTGYQVEPWYPLVKSAGQNVQVFKRGERSFVIMLPRTK